MVYIRMSLACFIFVLFSGIIYFRNRKLPLLSTKIFIFLFISTLAYLVFDAITIYTVNQLEYVDGKLVDTPLNYVMHMFFLVCIILVVYLFYVSYHTDIKRKKNNLFLVLELAPFVVTSILIIFLPIEYIKDDLNYSRGYKAYALYVGIVCYIVMTLYKVIKYGKQIHSNKSFSILLSIGTFIVISVIQIIFPTTLISAVGAGIFIISIVLSSENAEKYIDDDTTFFGVNVLDLVLDDWLKYKSKFTVLTVSIERFIYINRLKNLDIEILKKIGSEINERHQEYCYSIYGDSFALLLTDPLKCDPIIHDIQNILDKYASIQKVRVDYYMKDVNKEEEVGIEMIKDYITGYLTQLEDENISIDRLTGARNRNAFEREVYDFKGEWVNHWIVSCDLNQFKKINDTYGHSKGDEALKAFASIVIDSIDENASLYRTGGDEFVLLYQGMEEELVKLFDTIQEKCLKVNDLPFQISFSYGYANMFKKDAYNIADRHMYANKNK